MEAEFFFDVALSEQNVPVYPESHEHVPSEPHLPLSEHAAEPLLASHVAHWLPVEPDLHEHVPDVLPASNLHVPRAPHCPKLLHSLDVTFEQTLSPS